MPQADSRAMVRVGVAQSGSDGHMVIRLLTGSDGKAHQLSLAQARALSLELIKQVHQAETNRRLENQTEIGKTAFLSAR